MVNYYDILKVSPTASGAEIKSAYRRLARRLHPDSKTGSEETALRFAAIAEAYAVLGSARERSRYDKRLAEISSSPNGGADSLFASTNRHAQRWRQMVYEKRYNDIIDQMIAEERRESIALQKFLFPLVALLLSALFFSIIRPDLFWRDTPDIPGVLAQIAVVTLFVIGVIHIVGRMREAFERFGYDDNAIHESVLDDDELPKRHWPRYTVLVLIIAATAAAFGLGYLIGEVVKAGPSPVNFFSYQPKIDVLLYPPIFVLLVDAVHGIILSFEERTAERHTVS